ncbi:hypothetical protein [Priestia megaterium]
MTVSELIQYLSNFDKDSEIFISCEGGCVMDNEIKVLQKENKVILEIE